VRSQSTRPSVFEMHIRSEMFAPRKMRSPTTIGYDIQRPVTLVIHVMFFVS
jgi:hypothetical protein